MYLTLIFLPLLNLIIASLFGRFLGHKYTSFILLLNMFLCVIMSVFIFFEVGLCHYDCIIDVGVWINAGILKLNWIFLFDKLVSIMLLLVLAVSFLVHLYSLDYMKEDPHFSRFIGYLSLFTFFMIILVTSYNFVQLFLGWEGVGLSSYLLINFWYTRIQANKSAMKAIIVNRFGDVGIYISMLFLFYFVRSFDYPIIFSTAPYLSFNNIALLGWNFNPLDIICLFLFIGAVGKSAQIGLHTWLPDAMEGPTPVSALIHAATMVTAGVFVLIRCSPLLEYSPTILLYISIIGGITALFAGSIGMVQYDIKKVIAYSTCSQLGYMVLSCGVSNYNVSLFHLFNHGFFKALLFLGAGSVIHSLYDEQDMRKMGGLFYLLPLTYVAIVIGSLSLIGFPFLTGFYSKDVIIEVLFSAYSKVLIKASFVYWLSIITAFLTSFYSFRLLYLVFLGKAKGNISKYKQSHESSSYISYVLFILSFLCIFIGFLFKDLFVGLGTDFWLNSIFILPSNNLIYDSEFIYFLFKLIPVLFSSLGIFVSFYFYYYCYHYYGLCKFKNSFWRNLYQFLIKKWYFDNFYNNVIVKNFFVFSYFITFKLIDRGLVEVFGPLTIVRTLSNFSISLSKLQTGYIYNYIFAILLAVVLIFLTILSIVELYSYTIYIIIITFCFSTLYLFFMRPNQPYNK